MSFDESLFILPNESDPTQSGGDASFTFVLYEGSDSLKNYADLDKPYVLVRKEGRVPSVDTFDGLTASTGLVTEDILAVNAETFLKILESPSLGGGLEKHLYFSPEDTLSIRQILGEQILFLAIFHELYFLASVNKLAIPSLTASVNERYEVLRELLRSEQTTKSIFGVPVKDIQTYYTDIQNEYVGSDVRRIKSLYDIIDLITKEPQDIITYFSEGLQYHTDKPRANARSTYTASTRRGFNIISLNEDEFDEEENVAASQEATTADVAKNAAKNDAKNDAKNEAKNEAKNAVENAEQTITFNVSKNTAQPTVASADEGESKESEDEEGESKEAEDEEERQTATPINARSASTGEPTSVASSVPVANIGNLGRSIPTLPNTAHVPNEQEAMPPLAPADKIAKTNKTVKPPVLPFRNIRNTLKLRRNALARKKEESVAALKTKQETVKKAGPNTRRLSRAVNEIRKAKKEVNKNNSRQSTNNSHMAVYGANNMEPTEVVGEENENGYTTSGAVMGTNAEEAAEADTIASPKSSRGVRISGTSTIVNAQGLQQLSPTKRSSLKRSSLKKR